MQQKLLSVPGVGAARARQLAEARVETVLDLLLLNPKRYESAPAWRPIGEWREGETACIAGEITRVNSGRSRNGPMVSACVSDGLERCRITWFNLPFLRSQLFVGAYICATGKIQMGEGEALMSNPRFRLYEDMERMELPDRDRWRPVYAPAESLAGGAIERIIRSCLDRVRWPDDYLPQALRQKRGLISLHEAVHHIHQPDSLEAAAQGRRRLAYDELLMWQLEFARTRHRRQQGVKAPPFGLTPEIDRRIRARLPFVLTQAQDRAVAEICGDLRSCRPMFRLLQGDVGCGKTAVAVYAALVAIANKHQAALLAPTEILAQQHMDKINGYLAGSAVRTALAVGSLSVSEKARVRTALQAGEIDLVVGTHALLEPDVRFSRLGLVIIDEQHRFGVEQREALKSKGRSPHYLVLSATPIPRTQALAIVGDLDLSVIDTMPVGQRRVRTQLVDSESAPGAWARIREELDGGRQAYVVFPLVSESAKLPLRAVTTEIEQLRAGELQGYACGLLHGRMKAGEREEVVGGFRRGEFQALVCTTVVEVGVDIPQATVMAVFHAERYGLAQLHQLRGRIGRAGDQAWFFMFSERQDAEAWQRLRLLEETHDGFRIAEEDLKLRGPGQIMGVEQHGMPTYRFANLMADLDLLYAAQQDAQTLTSGPAHSGVRRNALFALLQKRYERREARLAQVG